MIQIGRDDHAVAGRIRQLGALGGNALGHGAPGAVVTHRATVSGRLELGQALHLNKKITVCRGLHTKIVQFVTVLRIRIRIRRIHMFLSLLDPDPNPLVRGILLSSCKNSKKNLDSYCFVTLFDFLSLKMM